MRKISSKEEQEKIRKRNQLIVGAVLIAVMVLSTIGFAFMSNKEDNNNVISKVKYNDIEFTRNGVFWEAKTDSYELQTSYNPLETENISLIFSISLDNFKRKPLFFASSDSETSYELLKNLYPYIERYQDVCLYGENCTNLVVKNCSDNIFVVKNSNITSIYKSNNCIFIESNYSEHGRIADRILFKIFKIQ